MFAAINSFADGMLSRHDDYSKKADEIQSFSRDKGDLEYIEATYIESLVKKLKRTIDLLDGESDVSEFTDLFEDALPILRMYKFLDNMENRDRMLKQDIGHYFKDTKSLLGMLSRYKKECEDATTNTEK